MAQPLLTGTLVRFWAGLAGSALVGWLVFREDLFRPSNPAFGCMTVGALMAGTLALVRMAGPEQALTPAFAYAVLCVAFTPHRWWTAGLSALLLGAGVLLVALVYDELARGGLRFGKFLFMGPLLGGVFLAIAPVTDYSELNVYNASRVLTTRFTLGFLIGDGAGLGVELVDLVLPPPKPEAAETPVEPRPPSQREQESPDRWKGRNETY